jgi:hypothetical protein
MRCMFTLPCVSMENQNPRLDSKGVLSFLGIRLYFINVQKQNTIPVSQTGNKTDVSRHTKASAEHNAAAARITKTTTVAIFDKNRLINRKTRSKTVFVTITITGFFRKKRSITETEQFSSAFRSQLPGESTIRQALTSAAAVCRQNCFALPGQIQRSQHHLASLQTQN